jgi:hypothetical protein
MGRNFGLGELRYDPALHLSMEPNGLWSWSEDAGSLSAWSSDYFRGRREDTSTLSALKR